MMLLAKNCRGSLKLQVMTSFIFSYYFQFLLFTLSMDSACVRQSSFHQLDLSGKTLLFHFSVVPVST